MKKDLSIIIVSYNTEGLTRTCLKSITASLKGSGISYEIIVVDNASADGSRKMLRTEFPRVLTVLKKDNIGFGRANNAGIQKAEGEYILLLNSDIIVTEDAISRLFAFAQRHPRSFIGGKLFNTDGSPQSSCGPFFTLPVVLGVLFLRGDRIGLTRYSPTKPQQVDWVSGACIMAPRKLFLDGLLFDEGIFMYMEEIDLLYRAAKKGYTTFFFPNAKFIHYGAASSGSKRTPILNIFRGFLYFYRKHYGTIELFLLTVFLRLKALLAFCFGVITGNYQMQQTYAEAFRLVKK